MIRSRIFALTVPAAAGTLAMLILHGPLAPSRRYVALAAEPVTWNKDIAPIVYSNCSNCHRPGEVAPFPLLNYGDAKRRARTIAAVTSKGFMPPWHADEGLEKFHDARRLTPAQVALFQSWAAQGAPEGGGAPPAAPSFTEGWQLGQPDAVLQPDEAYPLQADGNDVYRCFVVPTSYSEDRYVSAIEIRPSNRTVVHHVIVYLDRSGAARKRDAADPGPGFTSFGGPGFTPAGSLGGWAPGIMPRFLPAGIGMRLPKGADIVLQVHYHKSGKPETDLTKIGLHFCKEPVDKLLRTAMVANFGLQLPPGDANHEVTGDWKVPANMTVLGVVPHMHLLGHDMTVTATEPDGASHKLVRVPQWDFNWQTVYSLKDPLKLPQGSTISLVSHYDNSKDNPRNPSDPPRAAHWGEQTTDEMCIAFVMFTADEEHLTRGVVSTAFHGPMGGGGDLQTMLQRLVKMFDANGDGKLDDQERAALMKFLKEHRQQADEKLDSEGQ